MKFIGITGGVGAGKSEVLSFLETIEGVIVVRADDLAKELMEPGGACHESLWQAFCEEGVFDDERRILPGPMSQKIFSDPKKRDIANAIVHPAVKRAVLDRVERERQKGCCRFFFLEAALLLEEHYDAICDEIWYIYASEKNRQERLTVSRGYSLEKIRAIFDSQLSEETFRKRANRIIDNDGDFSQTKKQISSWMKMA